MKKVVLILCLFFIVACSKEEVTNKNEESFNKTIENDTMDPEYVDENPVEINIYLSNGVILKKQDSEYHTTYVLKKDIVVFDSLLCTDEEINEDYFQKIWARCAEKYQDINYKVGWHIEFSLENGENIIQTIFKPSDTNYFYDYLEIYLYDSANAPLDTWYSHLLDEEINENTIFTTMKLTAGSKYEMINSPIKVTVFTYDSQDDFDEDYNYLGKSMHQLTIYND